MVKPAAGTIVGEKYRLEEPVGHGGMASVWRAVHTTLESPVAVKFLDTYGISRELMTRRFLREAKLSANLRHRNVVHILDYGMLEDEQPYMVMELLEGQSLSERMGDADARLSDLALLEAMAQILGGLAAVHDAGIVHRDVKPDNIFLVRDTDGEYPKLLDFGISRGVDPSVGDTRMTNTGAVVGTPLYMSPEQARGIRDLDVRTDLWSVGMVLYEGLAGFCPFESENMGDVLIRVATEEPPHLSEVRPDLPASVVQAVMRALEKDREGRWEDARSMRDALLEGADALAHGEAGAGDPRPSRRYPSQRLRAARTGSSSHTGSADRDEADTRIEPSVLDEASRAASGSARRRRWWIAALASTAIAAVVAGLFIAAGGRIRFGGDPGDDPSVAAPPPNMAAGPIEGAAPESGTDETSAESTVTETAADETAADESTADESTADESTADESTADESTADELSDPAASDEGASDEGASEGARPDSEGPPETSETRPPPEPRARARRPRSGPSSNPSPAAERSPLRPRPEPPPTTDDSTPFLRDLDY